MSAQAARIVSRADARATLTRIGIDPKRIDEILADYPDPIDLTAAGPTLFAQYGISEGILMERLGSSP
jgi:hypothetical protein